MFDVLVIGGGPGGYAAGIRASQLGGNVAIIEKGEIGGTCVNRGCIPSKIWLRATNLLNMIGRGEDFGIQASVNQVNYQSIVDRKNGVARDIRIGMESLLANNGIELIRGRGILKNAREVDVEDKIVEAKNIILATGSLLDIPNIPGVKDVAFTTDQIMEMTEIPSSVIVFGEAGPIDVEMASLLNTLGSTVRLVTHQSRILAKEDHGTSQRLAQAFSEQGIEVLTRCKLESVKKSKRGFKAKLSGRKEQTVEMEKVVICTRKANTVGLELEQAGVRLNGDGCVWVNESLQTSQDGVYAIGDITGGWMNSHAASAMGVAAAENAMGQANPFPFNLIPRGTWTCPQMGAVGLTEEEAEEAGYEVEIGDFPYAVNGLAMSYGELNGSDKMVTDAKNADILGVHIVGDNATDLVGEAVMALQLECTAEELAHTIRVHPTFSEALVEAGRDATHWALYLPKR